MAVEFTEEDLEGLTEEEIAAIEDDDGEDGSDDGEESSETDPEEESDLPESDNLDSEETEAAEETPIIEPESVAEDHEDTDAGTEGAEKEDVESEPNVARSPSVDDEFQAKIKTLDEQLDEAEIDFDEYKKQFQVIDREYMRSIAREENLRISTEDTWKSAQTDFFTNNDYLKSNPVVYGAFAGEVNKLLADKAWSSKSGADILAKAKQVVDSAFGKPESSEKADVQVVEDKKKKTAIESAKKSGRSRPSPQTLRDIPASDINTDSAFDYLDKLDGREYEKAIEKLTEAEMEAYAAA